MRFYSVCAGRLLISSLVLLQGTAFAEALRWDCSVAADGVNWSCRQQTGTSNPLRTLSKPVADATPSRNQTIQSGISGAAVHPEAAVPAPQDQSAMVSENGLTPVAVTAEATGTGYLEMLDAGIDWHQCQAVALQADTLMPASPVAESEVLSIDADSAVTSLKNDTVQFAGSVIVSKPGQELHAETLSYDGRSGELSTSGAVFLEKGDLRIAGNNLLYIPDQGTGQLSEVSYRLPSQRIRGEAKLAQLTGKNTAHYEQITYTTCPPGNSDFILSADSMDIDRSSAIGTFRGAKLSFLGLPLFYVPKMSVSLDNKRKSGLLPPAVGYSSKNGADVTLPYYLNLAPNYDATLYPRIIGKRGLALGGEFRFLADKHRGSLLAEMLPDDRLYQDGSARGAAHLETRSLLAPNLSANVNLNYVSDVDYLEDLGDSLAVSSTRFLRNQARLNYHGKNWDFYAELRHYKTLDEQIAEADRPYSQLPGLRFDYLQHDGPGGISYSLLSEYIYFYKEDDTRGHRLDLMPGLSLPMRGNWWYVEPATSIRYTRYALSDQPVAQTDNPDRSIYSLSLDSGMIFERGLNWQAHSLVQTLEPRAYYLYTPYRHQDELPVFDTGLLDFNFDNLFRSNRFNGPDRVGDANQLTLALTSRLLSPNTGTQILSASIGQVFFFQDQRVTLPDQDSTDYSRSSFLAQLQGNMNNWQLRAGVQLDPNTDEQRLQQALAQATYRGSEGQLFHAAYRSRDQVVEQTDLAVIWPLSPKTSVIGRWYYSLLEDKTLEAVAGIEYGNCCWKLRAVLRHYLDNDGTEYNDSAMIQLELNGLGKLGNDIDQYLDRAIYGY